MEITNKEFRAELERIIDDEPSCVILSIPGVYEILAEEYNNAVLEALETIEYCQHCGEEATLHCELKPQPCTGCGEYLMPCTYCTDLGNACDWSSETDKCRFYDKSKMHIYAGYFNSGGNSMVYQIQKKYEDMLVTINVNDEVCTIAIGDPLENDDCQQVLALYNYNEEDNRQFEAAEKKALSGRIPLIKYAIKQYMKHTGGYSVKGDIWSRWADEEEGGITECVKGYLIGIGADCDPDCELQCGLGGNGNCYAECLVCGGDYIETKEGLCCSHCGHNGDDREPADSETIEIKKNVLQNFVKLAAEVFQALDDDDVEFELNTIFSEYERDGERNGFNSFVEAITK